MKHRFCLYLIGCALSIGQSAAQIYVAETREPNAGIPVTSICLGQTVRLFAFGDCPASWYDGTTLIGPNNVLVTPTTTGTVSYTARCTNGSSKTTTLTVNAGSASAPPVISTTSAPCSGGPIVLQAAGCSGTVKWLKPPAFGTAFDAAGPDGPTLTISPLPTSNTRYVAVCSGGGCTSAASNGIVVGPSGIVPDPPTLLATPASICAGRSSTLTATGCSGTVNWYTNPGGAVIGTGSSLTVSPANNIQYRATCTTGSCVSNSSFVSVTVTQPTSVVTSSASDVVTVPITGPAIGAYAAGCQYIARISTSEPSGNELYGKDLNVSVTVRPAVGTYQVNKPFVQRHYDVHPVVPLTPGYTPYYTVYTYYTQAEFDAFNAVSPIKFPLNPADVEQYHMNVRVLHAFGTASTSPASPGDYSGGTVSVEPPANRTVSWDAALNHWVVIFNTIGFSGFFLTADYGSLPVTWASFTVRAEKSSVVLDWETVMETKNNYFEIERSRDARSWETIGQVVAQRQDGQPRRTYQFVDAAPGRGIQYYRLKQVDVDGTTDYSRIQDVTMLANPDVVIGPVPAVNRLTVKGIAEPCQVQILDITGRALLTRSLTHDTDISLGSLAGGTYLLRLTDAGGTRTQRFVKQ